MSISRSKVEHIWHWYPSFRDNGIAKIVWFEVLNLALCFTVQMGFQSSDAIITKGLDESFNISGLYTLLVSIIIYFVILRSVLLEFFSSVPLIIRRVIRRIEDGTNTDIIPPVTYIMPYSYLPLNRRYKYLLLLKLWIAFKVFTVVFFICCPMLLLGYTVARTFRFLGINHDYHFKPKWNYMISLKTEVASSFIMVFGLLMILISFIIKSVSKSRRRFNEGRDIHSEATEDL